MKIHAKYLLRTLQTHNVFWISYCLFSTDYDLRVSFRSMSSSRMFACNQRSLCKAILFIFLPVQLEAAFDTTSARQNTVKIALVVTKPWFLLIRNINYAVWDCFTLKLYSQLIFVGMNSAATQWSKFKIKCLVKTKQEKKPIPKYIRIGSSPLITHI